MRGTLGLVGGAALLALLAAACTSEPVGAVEQDSTETKRLSYNLESPGNLVLAGDTLLFSTAHFVASGDPELDQQFAYWEGQLWTVPLAGGGKQSLAKTSGAVMATAKLGDDVLVIDSTYMGVTRYSVAKRSESDFYNDYTHFPDDSEELQTLGGVAVGKSGVYVTRPGSEVMRMKADGSAVTTFAKTWTSGWVEEAREIIVLDSAVFWSSEQQGEQGSTYNLYRASVSGTHTPKKLATYQGPISSLATDGEQVFVAIDKGYTAGSPLGEIDVVPADGSVAPRPLVADLRQAGNLVYDERFGLLYTDFGAGNVALVPVAAIDAGDVAQPVSVLTDASPTSIALDDEFLYVASDPGSTNEKKGVIRRYALSVLDAR